VTHKYTATAGEAASSSSADAAAAVAERPRILKGAAPHARRKAVSSVRPQFVGGASRCEGSVFAHTKGRRDLSFYAL